MTSCEQRTVGRKDVCCFWTKAFKNQRETLHILLFFRTKLESHALRCWRHKVEERPAMQWLTRRDKWRVFLVESIFVINSHRVFPAVFSPQVVLLLSPLICSLFLVDLSELFYDEELETKGNQGKETSIERVKQFTSLAAPSA